MAPTSGPRLRRARSTDLATLVRHRRAMWEAIGGFSRRELDDADPVYREWTRRMMRARRFIGWVAVDARGRATGSGAIWLTEIQPRPTELHGWRPYILSMYTEPRHRGEGIASGIVRAAVQFARDRGYSRITLHASKMGRPVYRRLGFERSWEMRQLFRSKPRSRRPAGRRARAR
ncbi:MAG: GNAT family N-acetyltransferase [Thermoplasmata archaeon]|nr:GNAT family N-acetyltransferase [Thermoplasmata archaeon]